MAVSTPPARDDVASLEAGLDALETPVSNSQKHAGAKRVRASLWPPFLAIAFLLVVWWAAYALKLKPEYVLPSPAAAWNSGKSMKLVPRALTCTPVRATSPATLRVSIVAPARTDEYSDAPFVGRPPAALVMTTICPLPFFMKTRATDDLRRPVP